MRNFVIIFQIKQGVVLSVENSPNNRLRLNYTSPVMDYLDVSSVSEFATSWFEGLRLPPPASSAQDMQERVEVVYPTPLEEIDAYCSEDDFLYYHHKDSEEETGSVYYSGYVPDEEQQRILEHSQEMLDEIQNNPASLYDFLDQQDRLLFAAVQANRASLIPILMENGCTEINAGDQEGNTLMHLAYKNRSREMMEVLLYYGASIHVKNGHGWSVHNFMEACDDTELDDWMQELEATFKSLNYRFPFERS